MHVGVIGLGSVGAKLAGSLVEGDVPLTVFDLRPESVAPLTARGARAGAGPAQMACDCDMVITCLPSPAASRAVVEGPGGLLEGVTPGTIWAEMSTTEAADLTRLAGLVADRGGRVIDCPVSGGCHRAATGNISIFAGCDRATFEAALPVLTLMGRRILHTGPLGSASVLKVMTNYLATTHLIATAEALGVMAAAGLDLATTFEAIRVSSGNSFVHETEGQLILSGSRDVEFTMALVEKDIGLFQALADAHGVPLDLSPVICAVMADGTARYGAGAQSTSIIRRIEDATGLDITAPGFPASLTDSEPRETGYEVTPRIG